MKTKARKIRVAKTKRRREKREGAKGIEEEGAKEERKNQKIKKRKNDRGKESGRKMGDMGQKMRSGEVWERGQEICSSKVSQVNLCLWTEGKWEDANKNVVRLCDRGKERFCTKEGEDLLLRKERG